MNDERGSFRETPVLADVKDAGACFFIHRVRINFLRFLRFCDGRVQRRRAEVPCLHVKLRALKRPVCALFVSRQRSQESYDERADYMLGEISAVLYVISVVSLLQSSVKMLATAHTK